MPSRSFQLLDMVPTWIFVVVFSRDLLIALGWGIIFILTGSSKIAPRILGKITTAVQMTTALACIINIPFAWQSIFLYLTVGCTIASALDYIISGEKRLGEWN